MANFILKCVKISCKVLTGWHFIIREDSEVKPSKWFEFRCDCIWLKLCCPLSATQLFSTVKRSQRLHMALLIIVFKPAVFHQQWHILVLVVQIKHVGLSAWARFVSVRLQVDSQGLLSNVEKDHSLPASSKSSIKRQTAAAYLRDQYQTSIRQKKANQARQDGSERRRDVHRSSPQTQTLHQPRSSLQSFHNQSSTLSSKAGTDYSKVCLEHYAPHVISALWNF